MKGLRPTPRSKSTQLYHPLDTAFLYVFALKIIHKGEENSQIYFLFANFGVYKSEYLYIHEYLYNEINIAIRSWENYTSQKISGLPQHTRSTRIKYDLRVHILFNK